MSISENQNPVQLNRHGQAGEWLKRNQADMVLIAGFILVAAVSFGIGYLSAPGIEKSQIIIEEPQANISGAAAGDKSKPEENAGFLSPAASPSQEQGLIVASKNGTKYYWPWSSWAKRIKPENLVWFKSENEAQAAGYSKSSDFDQIAPAGYKK